MGFLEGLVSESVDLGEQPSLSEGKMPPGRWGTAVTHTSVSPRADAGSVPGSLADLVIHLGEGVLATELLPQLVVQGAVEHLPELLAVHVAVGVQHLEPAEQRWG